MITASHSIRRGRVDRRARRAVVTIARESLRLAVASMASARARAWESRDSTPSCRRGARERERAREDARALRHRVKKTQAKIRTLKESLNTEFAEIFKLCIFVLGASSRPQLISANVKDVEGLPVLDPLGYLFETDLIRTLIERFFAAAQFRNAARVPHGNRLAGGPGAEVRSQNNPVVRRRVAGARAGRAAERVFGFRF